MRLQGASLAHSGKDVLMGDPGSLRGGGKAPGITNKEYRSQHSSETTVKLPHLVREIRQILVWKTPNNYLFAKNLAI